MPSITTAQLLELYTLRNTPLTLAQIAAPLTMYKRLNTTAGSPAAFSAIAKLTVPSGASVRFDNTFVSAMYCGTNRVVRASSVQIVSIADFNNNAVTSGTSRIGTVYTTGATVNAVDATINALNPLGVSAGPFSGSTCYYGIYGYTTLLEALCGISAPINLSAYGQ